MPRDLGYQFVVALSDAIERATAAFVREDATAFRYRGVDLRHAVERSLYVALVNHTPLYEAFRDERAPGDVAGLGSSLERAVATALLAAGADLGSGRPRWRRLAGRARWQVRAVREGAGTGPAPTGEGPVAFVLDHVKFLRFVEPVRRRLGPAGDVIVSIVPPLTAAATAVGEDLVDLCGAPERAPRARAIGVGLLGARPLLGLYDGLLEALVGRRPRCVVVVEGMSPVDELANRAARSLGIPTLCLQQGWSPFVHAGFRNMSYAAMAVWGDGFADLLAPHNPGQRFAAVGSFTLAAEVDAGRDVLAAELDGRPAVAFFLQPRSPLIRAEHQEALLALVARTAQRLSGCAVLVREHPAAPLTEEDRRRVQGVGGVLVDPQRFSLGPVLEASRAAVSIYSTSLVEAAALGSIPIVFNPTSMSRYSPDLDALGAGIEVRTPPDAEEAIARVVEDELLHRRLAVGVDAFRSRFFAAGGSPADATVALIDDLAPAGG
ncbi:MAG TPA: hypothetical protein VF257_17025 [Solirubrobacteraceae bacterium]